MVSQAGDFTGKDIKLAGSVFDTNMCANPASLKGCTYVEEANVFIEKAAPEITLVRYNQNLLYVPTQRVIVNCKGTDVSLRSVLLKSLPPGIKSCY